MRYDNGLRAICPDCYTEVYCRGKTRHYGSMKPREMVVYDAP